jgi:hypothetical protein
VRNRTILFGCIIIIIIFFFFIIIVFGDDVNDESRALPHCFGKSALPSFVVALVDDANASRRRVGNMMMERGVFCDFFFECVLDFPHKSFPQSVGNRRHHVTRIVKKCVQK